MGKRSIKVRLYDISEAISGITEALAGCSYEDFSRSWQLQKATERGLEIISEASRHIPDDLKALAAEVPWHKVAATGNILRHEYQRVEALTIWQIVKDDLPVLEIGMAKINLAAIDR